MTQTYASRIDPWLAVLIVAMTLVPLAFGAALLSEHFKRGVVLLAVGGFNLGFFLLLVVPAAYTLTATELEIRSGVMRTQIPLATIVTIERPAASPRRVRIVHGTDSLLLAPRDYERFHADLLDAVERARPNPPV